MTCEHWIEVKDKKNNDVGFCKYCGRIVDCQATKQDCEHPEAWYDAETLDDVERIR